MGGAKLQSERVIMPCPFLTRLDQNYVKNFAPLLIKTYGNHCPVISKRLNSNTDEVLVTKCPFLNKVPGAIKQVAQASDNNTIEVINSDQQTILFAYNEFFHEQIKKKKAEHSYRVFKRINRLSSGPEAIEDSFGAKPITVWCSNDYLGMSSHPQVKIAVKTALEQFGTGAGGTRNISGNSTLHEELERTLAHLHKKPAALLFTSCFVANDTTLFTLAKTLPGCQIFSDAGNHASMIQGIRNSQVPKHIFKHNDPEHLEWLLQKMDKRVPKLVALETVYSMTGSVCPLEQLCDIAHKYGALIFADEVHAVGLYGQNGAGIGERDNVMHKLDIVSGTLGKAFGGIGGYIAGSTNLIDTIRSYGVGFIFTTALPPMVLAGAGKAIEILRSDEGRLLRRQLQENVQYLRNNLLKNGFPSLENSASHIIPINVGDPQKCSAISDTLLWEKAHYVQAINYPTVPRGQEKLRLAPTPYHSQDLMDLLVADLKDVWQMFGLTLPDKRILV